MGSIIKLAAWIICRVELCYFNLFSSLVPDATAVFRPHDSAVAEGRHKHIHPCLQGPFIQRPCERAAQECVCVCGPAVFHHFGKLLLSFHVTKMDPGFFRNSLRGRGGLESASVEGAEVM